MWRARSPGRFGAGLLETLAPAPVRASSTTRHMEPCTVSFLRTTCRRTAVTLGVFALAWLPTTTSLAAAPQVHGGLATENESTSGSQYETTADLMGASGLSGLRIEIFVKTVGLY